jgi:hypothetical protein
MVGNDLQVPFFGLNQGRVVGCEVHRGCHQFEALQIRNVVIYLERGRLPARFDHPAGDCRAAVDGIEYGYLRASSARLHASVAMHSSTPRGSAQMTSTSSPPIFKVPLRFMGSMPIS